MLTRTLILAATAISIAFSGVVRGEIVPGMQRFLQRDPNGSGMMVLNDQGWCMGQAPMIGVSVPDPQAQYVNGLNLYQYLGSNTATRMDPMGLSYDSFGEVDDFALEHLFSGYLGVAQAMYRAKEGHRSMLAYQKAGFDFMDEVINRDGGILLGMVVGPFFSRTCFEGGTPVVLADGTNCSIEKVALGSVVFSTDDAAGEFAGGMDDLDAYATGEPAQWVRVDFRILKEEGNRAVSLLRPRKWLDQNGMTVGSSHFISTAEAPFEIAEVVSVSACPALGQLLPGGRFVTGISSSHERVLKVWLVGVAEPLGVTVMHPVFSENRQPGGAWVGVGELTSGELVRTLEGTARVDRIETTSEVVPVFNIEVHQSHTYYAGSAQVWVHNACFQSGRTQIHAVVDAQRRQLQVTTTTLDSVAELATVVTRARAWGALRGARTAVCKISTSGSAELTRWLRQAAENGRRVLGARIEEVQGGFRLIWEAI